ncbi:type I-E CRISPR-associated protein Cas7/Cse4/CasC [Selenomonas sp. KH1T6]|uniref:type I-E CRISPR-associated protein Cas7/Cse4/CasC n=1 Tax=Selenomonas sp. KH1T6 TaxID=3158784 RepID=UPI0008A7559E|nr:CRISPR-associated protein, Cse4 family [Selenomonas ruminantium]
MLIEIHMLKNYPATNLNRDDMGAPKSCVFGGAQRGRISSQCLKRSWRVSQFLQKELSGYLGVRTRKMPQLVVEKLKYMGVADEFLEVAKKKLTGFANKNGKESDLGITGQLIIYSPEDIQAVAEVVKQQIDELDDVKKFEKMKATDIEKMIKGVDSRPVSLDIALFGRMVTSPAFADVEASMQVAHAFSTNRVIMESDYFTAMDDMLTNNEELGAGMIGEVDYNSSCYYIYASLDVNKLLENLKYSDSPEALVEAAVPALLRAMAYSNPSGKQNTFAGNVLPSAVLVECKDYPVPVSYANAYSKPARAIHDRDLITVSIEALQNKVLQTVEDFPSLGDVRRFWFSEGNSMPFDSDTGIVNTKNYDDLVESVTKVLEL